MADYFPRSLVATRVLKEPIIHVSLTQKMIKTDETFTFRRMRNRPSMGHMAWIQKFTKETHNGNYP